MAVQIVWTNARTRGVNGKTACADAWCTIVRSEMIDLFIVPHRAQFVVVLAGWVLLTIDMCNFNFPSNTGDVCAQWKASVSVNTSSTICNICTSLRCAHRTARLIAYVCRWRAPPVRRGHVLAAAVFRRNTYTQTGDAAAYHLAHSHVDGAHTHSCLSLNAFNNSNMHYARSPNGMGKL